MTDHSNPNCVCACYQHGLAGYDHAIDRERAAIIALRRVVSEALVKCDECDGPATKYSNDSKVWCDVHAAPGAHTFPEAEAIRIAQKVLGGHV